MNTLYHKIAVLVFFIYFIQPQLFAGNPPFVAYKTDAWVEQQMAQLTMEEKIAQLMMITAYPSLGGANKNKVLGLIEKYKPGGILVMQGGPTQTAAWINAFQEKSAVPLLVAIDGEWGISMRTDSVVKFPYAQTLGAVPDSNLVIQMGRDFAHQMKAMGIQMNFAPVADINTNPKNPVINFRAFGEDKLNVAQKAWWVAKGMQEGGVVAVAKHFPGHGDTDTDSHKTLPFMAHGKLRMDTLETFPFRYLAERGVSCIMSAHLEVPSLDASGAPSSLSKKIINDYLKDEIGFHGLVITDAISMSGVRTQSGNAELEALIAGNDMVEFVPDLGKAIRSVVAAIEAGKITASEIDAKCRTVMALKRWAKLNEYRPAELGELTERLNSPTLEATNRKLIKNALTVLKNENILPVENLDTLKIASVMIGRNSISTFQRTLEKYTDIDNFSLPKSATEQQWANLRGKLENYNLIIVGVQGINVFPAKKYGTTEIQRRAVSEIIQQNKSIFAFFGNAYALEHFENIQHANGLVMAYQNTTATQELAAQLIFGGFAAMGKLPVSVDGRFKVNDGVFVAANGSLSYSLPEEMDINSALLNGYISSLATLGLAEKAYPGCQVLVAKNGNVIFHKAYGYHTFENEQPVTVDDIYDWASITKVTGPLPALMKLVDEKKVLLNAPFSKYWPDFKGTDKENLKMDEILAHQAKLSPWIPFWQMGLSKEGNLDGEIFKNHPSNDFSVRISDNLFLRNDYRKAIYDTIRNSKLRPVNRYLYSGLSFYLFPEIIENLTGENYEQYLQENFYKPLGANTVVYNPYLHFPMERIVPTETDRLFRKKLIHGFVHDEGAAMMGGISGNAGLFGTTNDLAKIFQMYLQKGYFGGKRYISEATVDEFIKIQFPENNNRRGLGFDKPLIGNEKRKLKDAYPAYSSSKNSFGHSGFTGTFAWADPDNGLLYIFMSNRVCPTRENLKLFDLNIRTGMHQKIYDSIKIGLNNP